MTSHTMNRSALTPAGSGQLAFRHAVPGWFRPGDTVTLLDGQREAGRVTVIRTDIVTATITTTAPLASIAIG